MVHSIYSETRPERNPTIWKHINLTVEKKRNKVTERLQRFLLNSDTHSTKQDMQHGQYACQKVRAVGKSRRSSRSSNHL